jgi:hypothetical protein
MPGLVVPLANFETELAQIDLGDGWELRPLGHSDLTYIGSNFLIAQHFTPQHHKDMTYALAQKCGPDEKPSSLDPRPGIDILRAMKLLHAGDMSTPLYFHYDVEGRSVIGGLLPAKRLGAPYKLLSSDLVNLRKLIVAVRGVRTRGDQHIEHALSRFDDACSRQMMEDQIVDCFTALESCLTPDTTSEIGFRLALRVAALLLGSRKAVYVRELMKVGYDVRSTIVHGGAQFHKLFSDKKFIKKLRPIKVAMGLDPDLPCITSISFSGDIVNCTRDALRVVILALAASYPNCDDLVADLDRRLADALETSGSILPL